MRLCHILVHTSPNKLRVMCKLYYSETTRTPHVVVGTSLLPLVSFRMNPVTFLLRDWLSTDYVAYVGPPYGRIPPTCASTVSGRKLTLPKAFKSRSRYYGANPAVATSNPLSTGSLQILNRRSSLPFVSKEYEECKKSSW